MSVHRDVTDLIGTTIKSPDLLWYEVHETDVENHVRLIGNQGYRAVTASE
jgi:hypothetical protein